MFDRRRVLQGMAVGAAGFGARAWGLARGAADAVPTAKVWGGEVSGYWAEAAGGAPGPAIDARRVACFKGIPYGADTRETRFRPPKRVAAWSSVKVCTDWAARAPQQSARAAAGRGSVGRPGAAQPGTVKPGEGNAAAINRGFNAMLGGQEHFHLPAEEGAQSEDCLHVNVWSASLGSARKRLPVLVYLHGGGYNNGSVNSALYDGTRLAQRGDVVVVTVNHRLNAFGFLYLGGMAGLGYEYRESGNVGMLDLVLALEWVRDNIAAFGGDAARVTIFGQQGGGAKCATLMAMEHARGLFHRVWTMSGQQVWGVPAVKARKNAEVALAAMGLEPGTVTREQLSALTTEQVQAGARSVTSWLPVVDAVVLKRDPFSPDAPPMSDAVPMVLGNTRDEGQGATAWRQAGLTWETLPAALGKELDAFRGAYSVDEIVGAYRTWYPAMKPVDVYVAASAAFRNWPGQVLEAERRAANAMAATRTWVYEMDWRSPVADGRAPQAEDIAFAFDNLRATPGVVGDNEAEVNAAQALATQMSARLVQFARTGVPGGVGFGGWPVYGLKRRETMSFDTVSKVVNDPRGQERKMMAGAGWRQQGT